MRRVFVCLSFLILLTSLANARESEACEAYKFHLDNLIPDLRDAPFRQPRTQLGERGQVIASIPNAEVVQFACILEQSDTRIRAHLLEADRYDRRVTTLKRLSDLCAMDLPDRSAAQQRKEGDRAVSELGSIVDIARTQLGALIDSNTQMREALKITEAERQGCPAQPLNSRPLQAGPSPKG